MNTEDFLRRVVPPGNFLVVSNTFVRDGGTKREFYNRFYKHEDASFVRSARYVTWRAKEGDDAYFALASFSVALPNGTDKQGRQKYLGNRYQTNAQNLKAFWVDLDVARVGDGKKPAEVWPDRASAKQWLVGFCHATGMPRPNMVVDSGYGYHVYWVLETPMARADWQPYADALRTMLVANKFLGDQGISSDSARVLRPHNTYNMKSGQPVLVRVLDKHTLAMDYPNQLVLQALQPYVGVAAVGTASANAGAVGGTATVATTLATAQALAAGGNVSSIFAGRAISGNMTNAAIMPEQSSRPSSFAKIASQCAQVATSLAEHGANDHRGVWFKGHITLAAFCVDGADFIHPISDGWPAYKPQEVDDEYARAQRERADPSKKFGPMHCTTYDGLRPGICATCPHFKQINTPWVLGFDRDLEPLPEPYMRSEDGTAILVGVKLPKGGVTYDKMIDGDVGLPRLNIRSDGFELRFSYYNDDKEYSVYVRGADLGGDAGAMFRLFEQQHVLVNSGMLDHWRAFILAWINQLRAARRTTFSDVHPFGWATTGDNTDTTGYAGFAVAGTLYKADGTIEPTPPTDPSLERAFTPVGTLDNWTKATNYIMAGRPELQMVVAVAFGAPLMTFSGQSGVAFNVYSEQSGVGKSSAMKAGCAVWARPKTMSTLIDTSNKVSKFLELTRSMPSWWDEMRGGTKDRIEQMVEFLMMLTLGQGKGRLGSDATIQEVGEWETILMSASNYPVMDHVLAGTASTDAGAVRLFEWSANRPGITADIDADDMVQLTQFNYGHAGRIYAAYIGANAPKLKRTVRGLKDALSAKLSPTPGERFLISGMAVCLVGASVANRLNLCNFDIPTLTAFQEENFLRMRAERTKGGVFVNGVVDTEQLFADFMDAHVKHYLITKNFLSRGHKRVQDYIVQHPSNRDHVHVHGSQQDRELLVLRSAFNDWCKLKQHPARSVLGAMDKQWGASVAKRSFAGGTPYATGNPYCIVIPAVTPLIADFLDPTTSHAATVATPTPGNQPKV